MSSSDSYGAEPTPGSGSAIDTNAGASGSSGGFSLSRGGLIAIIVVVVLVVVLGAASTILFVLAKRRQWNIRASIARASRRLTGRGGGGAGNGRNRAADRQSKRAGVQLDDRPPRQGHKRGLVVEVRDDVEKGNQGGKKLPAVPPTEKPGPNWAQRFMRDDWK